MNYYKAYNLDIQSSLSLPGFLPSQYGGDVTVREEPEPFLQPISPGEWAYTVTDDEISVMHTRLGRVRMREGRAIGIGRSPNTDDQLLALYLTGAAMAYVLFQRGTLALHASAVAIDGGAAIFLGSSGWGKSSMAFALHARGHGILVDDVSAVDVARGLVSPGFPQLKVGPEVAALLGYDYEKMVLLHPQLDERGYRSAQNHPPQPIPLHGIVVLTEGPELRLERMRPQEALLELASHTFGYRVIPRTTRYAEHFQRCAALAGLAPVYRLTRPKILRLLPETASIIEDVLCRS